MEIEVKSLESAIQKLFHSRLLVPSSPSAAPLPLVSECADEEESLCEGGEGAAEAEDPPVEVARPHVQAEVGQRHRSCDIDVLA